MSCRSNRNGLFRSVSSTGGLAVMLCALVARPGTLAAASGMIRFIAINNDSDSGIDASKVYTHLFDFGNGTPGANINGVQFTPATIAVVDSDPTISYAVSSGSRSSHDGNASHNVSGNLVDLMTDMIYNGGNVEGGTATFTLSNLTPGQYYETRIYTRPWGGGGGTRTSTITFDPDGAGWMGDSVTLLQDDSDTYPPGFASANQAYVVAYQFRAAAEDVTIAFAQQYTNQSWHQYGLSNEWLERAIIPTLYSTGVDDYRMLLASGTLDPHYQLVSSPEGYTEDALKITPHSAWTSAQAEDANSGWIGPTATAASSGVAPGTYVYETTFDLRGFLIDTAELTVAVARDDSLAGVYLNGDPVTYSQAGYTLGSPFTITSGFVDGINTLSFAVNNGGTANNPHGLRVEVWGTAMVPEPASVVLFVLAGVGVLAGGRCWRRRCREGG